MAVALVARGPDPASPRCFGGLLVVRRQGRPLGGCGRSRVADLPRRTVAAGTPCSERKRSPDSSDGVAAAPSGVALPTEGAILEWQPRCTLGVKTRSRFWTSDGGAYGRRNLHGGVISRDTVCLLAWSAFCLRLLRWWQQIYRWACVMGGCLPHAAAPALLSWWLEVSTQLRFRLLAASHSAWGCFAIPGAVRDNVEERRLQLRRLVRLGLQRIATWFSTWLKPRGAVHRRKMAWATSSASYFDGGVLRVGKQRLDFVPRWWPVAPGGRAPLRATSTTILETSPKREPCSGF
jgi:hypothetical protein